MSRKPDQVIVTMWMSLDKRTAFKKLCEIGGISMSEYLREVIDQADIDTILAVKQGINDKIKAQAS